MNMKIGIRFNSRSTNRLERSIKTCTTRSKKLGDKDDHFFVVLSTGTKRYKLTKVVKVPFSTVYHYYYKQEGYYTKEEFGRAWVSLHPLRGIDMGWLVWLHVFKEIPLGI